VITVYHTTIDQGFVGNITDLKSRLPTMKRSNSGGWQSPFYNYDSLIWAQPTVDRVKQLIPYEGKLTYWFNVNGPGSSNNWHDHGDFGETNSGCLYIDVPKNSGAIEFAMKPVQAIEPTVGMFLLFANNVKHRVLVNNSNNDRITMAFNFWRM